MASGAGTGGPPPGTTSGERPPLTVVPVAPGVGTAPGAPTDGSLRAGESLPGGGRADRPSHHPVFSPGRREVQPPTRLVYVAHAIDFKGAGEDQTERVLWELAQAGHATFDPATAWTVPDLTVPNRRLMFALYAVIGCMDGLVAVMDRDCPTVGTILELEYAKRIGVPTVVCGNVAGSWALAGLGVEVFADENDAVAALTRKMEN